MIPYHRINYHLVINRLESIDCGIFAIAYAIDLLQGHDPSKLIYDQSKMREHLIDCFEKELIQPFPKYKQHVSASQFKTNKHDGEWILPRRSARIKSKTSDTKNIKQHLIFHQINLKHYLIQNQALLITSK